MKYKTLKDNNFILPHILLSLRGCLLALFCSLFVLTACGGGGGAATTTTGSAADNCPTDPFGATCGNEYAAARTQKINECLIDDMATEDASCASAVNAQSCLEDPFARGCDEDQGFSAFLEVAKDQREAFCNIGDNANDTLCAGAVSTVCGDNPFNGLCKATSYIRQQGEIVADCITEGKASESTCVNAVEFNPCIGNPFTPECVTQTDARTMREAFCRKDDNATNALCAGALAHFCELDPFDAICGDVAYSRQQMERVDFCISDDNASNNNLCANAVAQDACIRDPFTVTCSTQDVYRSIRESFCRQGTNAADNTALCGNAVLNICTNDPFDGVCNPNEYTEQRNARTIECEDEEPTNSRCTNVLLFLSKMTCMDDPFGKGCEGETALRMTRENTCRASNNALGLANDSQCTGALAHFCGIDPFDGLCNPTTYTDERTMRVAECIMDDNASDTALCANAILANNCISNPYGTNCGSETAARTARETFCRDGNPSNPLCTGAVVHFCRTSATANPFDAELCMTYGSTRDSIIRSCITADDTRWRQGACANAVAANPCIETPFDRNCVTDFANYYQDARAKRTTFCVGQENTYDLCAGAVATNLCFKNPFVRDLDNNGAEDCSSEFAARREAQINTCIARDVGQTVGCINVLAGIGGCLANPFHSSCHADVDANSNPNTYFKDYADAARAARVDFCDMDDGAIRDHDYCFGRTFNYDICVYDPYSSFCDDKFFTDAGDNTTVVAQRTKKVVFCGRNGNKDHGSCTHVRDLVTAATWAHGLGSALNTQPTGTNEFLRADDLDNANELDKGSTGATGTNLNLATSTFDYNQFGGNATDGVEFFAGSGNYYAGIFGGADLGKPLSGDARTVYWNGRISSTISTGNTNSDGSTTSDAGGVIVATDFTLTINFDGSGGTLESFAKVFLDETANNHYYDIDGTFNADGLITGGTVVYAQFTGGNQGSRVTSAITDATLSGIIGEEGALGVFQGTHFSGGFVAHPTIKARVETSDWVRGFGDSPPATAPTAGNGFLQEDNGVLTLAPTKITAGGADTTAFEFVTLKTVNDGEQDFVNDVSWFSGYHTDNIQYHYATVSDTAYLGEPLSEAPTSGIWYGKFGAGANKTDFALTITYGVSERKISAFVRESVGVYYLLAGDFNSAGVITNGTVNYGAFANGVRTAPVSGRAANGTLTGLIGKDGVLGAFHSTATGAGGYAGGFWAAPAGVADVEVSPFNADVDYDDYRRSFLPLADAPTAENQFLAISGVISTTGTTATQVGGGDPTVYSLDLNERNLDGDALGLHNTANRVDWFSGYISTTQYHYAGVGRANLGAPLTTTPVGGEWRGVIGVGKHTTDFTLTITYGTAGGTLSAFVRDTPNVYYLLDGGFDANGLIDGTVRYGTFTNNDRNSINDVAPSGVLTGLIGEDGALGVFHSTATGAAGYSGGFVARPNAPIYDSDVKYSDYRRSFLSLDLPDTTAPKNQFVTDSTGVMTAQNGVTPAPQNSLALDTTTFDDIDLAGNLDNGAFWFNGFAGSSSTRTYYAGLDDRADLGLPITMSGNWRGVFAVGNAKTDFTLEITYGTNGGTIAAFIHELEDSYYLLAGDFDANGLITGTVNYGVFTNGVRTANINTISGTLTGLIGEDGAVGAFYSNNGRDEKYSGGFVARDGVAAFVPSTVRHATWARGFLLADTPDTTDPRNQFLRARNIRLDSSGKGVSDLGVVNLNTARFNDAPIVGGDVDDQYEAFRRGTRYYAGILPSTDLGAPVVDGSTELTWYGNLTVGRESFLSSRSTDFVLNITINGTTGGTLSARANYRNTEYYILDGEFDASGLITGTIAYNLGSFDTTANGILTGLIGQEGAIGVFIGDTNNNYGGGFVARPKSDTFTDSVKYSDWLARENPDANPSDEHEFLQTTGTTIPTNIQTSVTQQFTLDLGTAEFDGAPIFGDANDGFYGFYGDVSGDSYGYVGIYDSTDLGAPLVEASTPLMWNGVLRIGAVEKSTTFTITYDGTLGTIDAFVVNISGPNDFLIDGTFDDLGIITGTTNFAAYAGNSSTGAVVDPDESYSGILSGLIGAEGAVGVFHVSNSASNARYSGGFIASPDIRQQANWNDWQNSFGTVNAVNLDSTPNTVTRENQFLYGDTGILSVLKVGHSFGAATAEGFALGLNDGTLTGEATYGGERLGGNGVGGIKYWHGFQTTDPVRLYYAQINNDTKLGPVIDEVSGTATYNGQFIANFAGGSGGGGFTTDEDFTLTVTFGSNARGGAGDVDAFVAESGSTGRHYRLYGSYNTDGVITGDVQYGRFTLNDPLRWETQTDQGRGFLTGLISQDNALGVFVSGDTRGTRGQITGIKGDLGFVGGFIARRTASAGYQVIDEVDDFESRVTYNDWNRIINPVATASSLRSQFLQIKDRGIRPGTLNVTGGGSLDLATAQFEGAPALTDGDRDDGFSYFVADTPSNLGYAGIFDGTNLGGLLVETDSPTLTWHGQLNFLDTTHDFTLNIAFNGNKINGFVRNIDSDLGNVHDLFLEGTFDDSGVITGTTNFTQFTGSPGARTVVDPNDSRFGILSGLIGQEGAVGVFYSEGDSFFHYSGGFVVHPDVINKVTYTDWVRGARPATVPFASSQRNQFVRTTGKVIDPGTLTRFSELNLNLGSTKFEGDAIGVDGDDGVVFFKARLGAGTNYDYAGIYDSTNLGAPLPPSDESVTWNGVVSVSSFRSETEFTITFDGAEGTIDAFVRNIASTSDFLIAGKFDASGLITGDVHYATFADEDDPETPNPFNGTLSGLIGQEGAVAVFYSTSGDFSYSGGFVAHPDIVSKVTYADWLAAASPTVPFHNVPFRSPWQNQFLQTSNKAINAGSGFDEIFPRTPLNLNTAEFDGAPIGGDGDDGFAFFRGDVGHTFYYYAGLFDSTDLGVLLTPIDESVTWNGVIDVKGVRRETEFTITFDGTDGTIDASATNFETLGFDRYNFLVDGNFDANGVISGKVHYAVFTTPPSTFNGTLSGLIGAEGAVAVFHGGGYGGGFVASPDVKPQAKWSDWQDSFGTAGGTNLDRSPIDGAQFLYGGGRTFSDIKQTATNGAPTSTPFTITLGTTATYNNVPLGGDGVGGIRYWHGFKTGDEERRYYAQIDDDTTLGTVIDRTAGTATYNGRFTAVKGGSSIVSTATDFTLTVNFADSSIEALVKQTASGNLHYLLEGTYDENGVISGDVTFDNFTDGEAEGLTAQREGQLRGLISQDYAMGVFIGGNRLTNLRGYVRGDDARGDRGFVGGFVAGFAGFAEPMPITENLADVSYGEWALSFSSFPGDVRTSDNQFSRFDASNRSLRTSKIYTTTDSSNGTKITPTTLNLRDATFNNIPLGGNATGDAVAFGSGFYGADSTASRDNTRIFFAGIQIGAKLGDELPTWVSGQRTKADWHGQFRAESRDGTTTNTDFTLEVNFENRQVEAFVPVAPASTTHYHLQGSFPADDDGVIVGTVDRGDFTGNRVLTTNTNVPGVFTGIIAQEGALGVFISGTRTDTSPTLTGGQGNTGYIGGFVACPLHTDGRCMSATR